MTEKLEHQSLQHRSAHHTTEDPDATSAKPFFRALFLHGEKNHNTKVMIEFTGSGTSAEIGKKVVGSIDKILMERFLQDMAFVKGTKANYQQPVLFRP